ncbi:MAG TPA: Spy/CpxP family protein refolding chaperone [Candidatus Binatia bacterium]|jgi:Spy/CpxP family protein refolding chaperone
MNKIRTFVLASSVFAISGLMLVNTPMAASSDTNPPAKPGFARGRMGPGFFGAPLITIALNHKSELNLTTDQITSLENIRSNYQSQATPAQQQLSGIEKEIGSLTQQTPANLVQIKSKLQDAEKYRTELRYLRIEALENGRSVLTDQQKEQLKTLVRSQHRRSRTPQGQPS